MARRVTQTEIARLAGVDVSTVNKILNRKPGTSFSPATVQKVLDTAIEAGYDFTLLRFRHRRRGDRSSTDLQADVVLRVQGGKVLDRGTARVRDLGPGGARLGGFELEKGVLPIRPFRFELRFLGLKLLGRPVRFAFGTGGDLEIGVEFVRPSAAARKKISEFINPGQP